MIDEVVSVELDRRPDRAGIAAEAPLPQTKTQYRYQVGALALVVCAGDQPAARGGHTEHLEVIAGDQFTFDPLRFVSRAQVEGRRRDDGEAGHHRVGVAIVEIVGVARVAHVALIRILATHLHETIGFGDAAERPQQQCVHQAEDGGVRANPERQGQDGDQRERRGLQQHPDAESKVLHHLVLPPLPLQPESIPKRARAPAQQIPLVPPIETIPIAQEALAIPQFRVPLFTPIDPQPARHDHADDRNQTEMRLREKRAPARRARH